VPKKKILTEIYIAPMAQKKQQTVDKGNPSKQKRSGEKKEECEDSPGANEAGR